MSNPKKYSKRPVIIDAMQFEGQLLGRTVREFEQRSIEIARWCGGRFDCEAKPGDPTDVHYWIDIPTLEGIMKASVGDFIIKGVQGEFYPCKPDIFTATYEAAKP